MRSIVASDWIRGFERDGSDVYESIDAVDVVTEEARDVSWAMCGITASASDETGSGGYVLIVVGWAPVDSSGWANVCAVCERDDAMPAAVGYLSVSMLSWSLIRLSCSCLLS